jgi:hypothetical protein
MPNDAKLGLVAGVGLVLAVSILFVRKDGSGENQSAQVSRLPAPATGVSRTRPVQQVSGGPRRPDETQDPE